MRAAVKDIDCEMNEHNRGQRPIRGVPWPPWLPRLTRSRRATRPVHLSHPPRLPHMPQPSYLPCPHTRQDEAGSRAVTTEPIAWRALDLIRNGDLPWDDRPGTGQTAEASQIPNKRQDP